VIDLNCVDGTVGDAYDVTLVGTDGMSHAVSYTNIINVGVALTGTVTTTNAMTAITFTGS
jgi:hypothetical protein